MLFALLLQVSELAKGSVGATQATQEVVNKEGGLAVVFFWSTIVLLTIVVGGGIFVFKFMASFSDKVEKACELKLAGYQKAELELKAKHATEIALNESNHQSVIKGYLQALSDSNEERRQLTLRINTMAKDMADLFDTFAGKLNTFAELQASQIAYLQTIKAEILLEITRLFTR